MIQVYIILHGRSIRPTVDANTHGIERGTTHSVTCYLWISSRILQSVHTIPVFILTQSKQNREVPALSPGGLLATLLAAIRVLNHQTRWANHRTCHPSCTPTPHLKLPHHVHTAADQIENTSFFGLTPTPTLSLYHTYVFLFVFFSRNTK